MFQSKELTLTSIFGERKSLSFITYYSVFIILPALLTPEGCFSSFVHKEAASSDLLR